MAQINFDVFRKFKADEYVIYEIKNKLDSPILKGVTPSSIATAYTAVWGNTIDEIYRGISKNSGFSKYNICYEATSMDIDNYDLLAAFSVDDDDGFRYKTPYNMYSIFNEIELSSCIKVNDQSDLETTLVFIEAMIEKPEIYGVLLTDGAGNFLNPAHPIVAKRIKEAGIEYFFEKPFKIIVYAWRNSSNSGGRLTNIYNLSPLVAPITEPVMSVNGISNMLGLYTGHRHHPLTYINADVTVNHRKLKSEYVVVPVQVAQYKGIVYPWYGVVARRVEEYEGHNIGPMLSPNISCEFDSYNQDPDEVDPEEVLYEISNTRISSELFNVCTGSYPTASVEGLATLNVANFDSRYHTNSHCLDPVFIKSKMAEQSLGILRS